MSRFAAAVATVREVVAAARDQQVGFLAAAVAYFGFVSLVPLLLLTLAIGSALGGDRIAEYVVSATSTLLAPTGQDLIREALLGASGRGGATVVGVALLAWTGLKLFRGLDMAFAEVYHEQEPAPLFEQLRDAAIVLAAIGVAGAAVIALGGVLPLLDLPFTEVIAVGTLLVALLATFFPIYYVFPNVRVTPREVLPGTLFAAVGWTVLTGAFRVYVAMAGQYDLYGVLGGVLLLVTWLYFAGNVIILGAILNRVLAGRHDESDAETPEFDDGPAPDIVELDREVEALADRLDEKTVSKSALEGELKAYVRSRVRRSHARGWGPYLVLLYGTGMTLGAFYFLSGGWAILAMVVVWLSTLGLYALMLIVGAGVHAAGLPGRAVGWVRSKR